MDVQCYKAETTPAVSDDTEPSYGALARDLGLDVLATIGSQAGDICYPELTPYEAWIWSAYLPTRYSRQRGDWQGYQFDVIPGAALREVQLARDMGCFLDMEIWTPEVAPVDPMIVGCIGRGAEVHTRENIAYRGVSRYFPIVRYAESLVPFETIEAQVLARHASMGGTTPARLRAVLMQDASSNPHITQFGYGGPSASIIVRKRHRFYSYRDGRYREMWVA